MEERENWGIDSLGFWALEDLEDSRWVVVFYGQDDSIIARFGCHFLFSLVSFETWLLLV